MVELVDTLDLGSSLNKVGVRVSFKVNLYISLYFYGGTGRHDKFKIYCKYATRAGSNPAKSK